MIIFEQGDSFIAVKIVSTWGSVSPTHMHCKTTWDHLTVIPHLGDVMTPQQVQFTEKGSGIWPIFKKKNGPKISYCTWQKRNAVILQAGSETSHLFTWTPQWCSLSSLQLHLQLTSTTFLCLSFKPHHQHDVHLWGSRRRGWTHAHMHERPPAPTHTHTLTDTCTTSPFWNSKDYAL